MVVAELTLTIVLLAGAGLMIRSFLKLYSMDIGVDISRMLTMRLTLAEQEVSDTRAAANLFYEAMLSRLAAMPGVAAVVDHQRAAGATGPARRRSKSRDARRRIRRSCPK